MHIEFLRDDGTGRAVLRAQQESGDLALPIDSLIFDASPGVLDGDRVAVAGTLLFAGVDAGSISFNKAVSPEVASAIHSATGHSVGSKISTRKLEGPHGEKIAEAPLQMTTLDVSFSTWIPENTPGVDRTHLGLVPGERLQGALYGVKESVVSSNAWLVASYINPYRVLLAAGLLFSHDLLAQRIEPDVPEDGATGPASSAQELCSAVGIDIS